MRRKPSRAKARSWYSRLASCTASAFATRAGGNGIVTCKNRGSSSSPTRGLATSAKTFTRAFCVATVSVRSSRPSIWVRVRCWRTMRNWAVPGRSGLRLKRDWPALATALPAAFHKITSLAESCSRMRSSTSPAAASGTWASCTLAVRAWVVMSSAMESRDTRARFTPATSAPSTLTSNQLSMDRVTNWYDTT